VSTLSRLTDKAPSTPTTVNTLPSSSNLLHVSVETCQADLSREPLQCLLATTADRRLHRLGVEPPFPTLVSESRVHESPVLSCLILAGRYVITTSMSGQVLLFDLENNAILDERRDHRKYVIKVTAAEDDEGAWVATAGWDAKIHLYRLQFSPRDRKPSLGLPIASLTLPTNPEAVLFVPNPDFAEPVLIVSRRDSTSLYYYSLPSRPDTNASSTIEAQLQLLGAQNLAPHSNAWVAFSPSSLALCPTDPTLVAVATSAVPYMKLIIVRLLLPPPKSPSGAATGPISQAEQSRLALATQDREDAAIMTHTSTLAPQTPYSTPQVCWRPDGTGVWVNGDDGVLRGVEAKTGKIVTTSSGGHDAGSKIRAIWAGLVYKGGRAEEWVVSGGFDRRLVVWRIGD